ncbi:MAG: hypothetical protein HOP29_13410 [Phycisphaerales bacterium]|nr:hypothetical protein [Phycisphaerales bacterium]
MLLLTGAVAWAQQPERDPAEALQSAIQRFDEGDYVGAAHALSQVDPRRLDDAGRQRHGDYVQRAQLAVAMQEKADADFEAAGLAAAEGRVDAAKRLYQSVIDNEYAHTQTRSAAEAALVALVPVTEPAAAVAGRPAVEGDQASPPTAAATEEAATSGDMSTQLRALRAKVLTREGREAMSAGRMADAERLYRQAMEMVPGYPEAEQGLAELGDHEWVESGAEDLLGRIGERNAVAWQRTVTTFQSLENETRTHVQNDDYPQARQAMLRAVQVVESGKGFADPVARYEALLHDAEALKNYVEDEERLFHEREVGSQREEARRENEERVESIRENRQQRIAALMSQALQHRKDRDYESAINVLQQVAAIDPDNDAAKWMIESLEDQRAYAEQRELREEFTRQSQRVLIDAETTKIPWWQEITYPKNWQEIVNRPTRIPPGSERERGGDLHSRLEKPVRLDFQGDPLGEVIQQLAEATETNISVAWNDLSGAGVRPDTPVQLSFAQPVTLGTALREVLDNVNGSRIELGYLPVDDVIKVASRDVLDRTTFEQVYDVTDLLMPVPNFDDAPRMDLANPATLVVGEHKRVVTDEGDAIFPEDEVSEEELDDQANELVSLIRRTIDPDTWRETGGGIGSITEVNGQLVITQTPSGQARIGGLLQKLREQRAIQIAIEARFITVQSNYLEEMGIDLDVILNAGNAGFDLVSGGGGGLAVDPVLGSRLLLPRSFSRLGFTPGVPGVGTGLTSAGPFPQPFGEPGLVPQSANNSIGGSNVTPLPVVSNILQFTDPGQLTSDLPGSFAGNPTLQPAFNVFGSFLDNIQVDFLIRATQADSRTTLVTAPRLVLFNGQRSWVAVVNQQSFVSSLQPVVDATGQAPIISTIETGAVLDAQGTVSADRRYVTLTLRPSVGRLLGIQTFGFSIGPGAGSGSFVQLPNITRTVVRTTVSVPDGGTLLIGGQKLAGEIETESGVPILSKIPILKRLYSGRVLVKDEQVLLILIKPKIIIQQEAEQEAFPSFSQR